MNKTNYKGIILAGGKGTRLYPITKEIPKPLLPVKSKPIINYLVDLFKDQGIKDIAVLINKEASEDFNWWKKRYYPNDNIQLTIEEEPLGTFGGLYLLKEWIGEDKFFLTNGDEIKKLDLNKLADFHNNSGYIGTIALYEVENPQDYGVVVHENGKVKEFLEKPQNPPTREINSGLYFFNPDILQYAEKKFLMTEKDIFPKLATEGKLGGFRFEGYWTDCGTWERYEKALSDTY